MKYIIYLCKPSDKEKLLGLLKEHGIIRVLCSEVEAYDQRKSRVVSHRGETITVNHSPCVKVEAAINDKDLPAMHKVAQEIGSGKLFVLPMEEAHAARTNTRNDEAI